MPTFTPALFPRYEGGQSVGSQYAVHRAQFGDGYAQVAAAGINNVRRTVTLEWPLLTLAQAAYITQFMDARGGHETFDYALHGESYAKWRCASTQVRAVGELRAVSVTLEGVP
jgi:phage-related protein